MERNENLKWNAMKIKMNWKLKRNENWNTMENETKSL